jgi:hypothetical protein
VKIYVICCNDSIEYVFQGTEEQALEKMKQLEEKHYIMRLDECSYEGPQHYREYCDRCFWHFHNPEHNISIADGLI